MNLSHSDKPLELFVFLEAAEEFVNKKGLDRNVMREHALGLNQIAFRFAGWACGSEDQLDENIESLWAKIRELRADRLAQAPPGGTATASGWPIPRSRPIGRPRLVDAANLAQAALGVTPDAPGAGGHGAGRRGDRGRGDARALRRYPFAP